MNADNQSLLNRITIKPGLMNGKPTIRSLRFRVKDLLELLSSGMTEAEILEEHPILDADDIRAALLYTSLAFTVPQHMEAGIGQGIDDIQKGDVFTMDDFEQKYKKLLK